MTLSRRKFTFGLCASAVMTITGCATPVEDAAIDILSLFWSNPAVKWLSFLNIIRNTISGLQKTDENNKYVRIKFDTINPSVSGLVLLSKETEGMLCDDGYCDFIIPNQGTLKFSPIQYVSVNNLSYGDEEQMNKTDDILLEYMRFCSEEVLNTGESNLINQMDLRLACLERMGYSKIHSDYYKIKYQKYESYEV